MCEVHVSPPGWPPSSDASRDLSGDTATPPGEPTASSGAAAPSVLATAASSTRAWFARAAHSCATAATLAAVWLREKDFGSRCAPTRTTRSVAVVFASQLRVFDATHRRGAPLRFRLDRNEVIEGLDAAAAQLSAGERAKVRMGCDRAYGDRGFPYLVPPKTALVFDLEMLGAES